MIDDPTEIIHEEITYEEVLARFDKHVPWVRTTPILRTDNGFDLQFRVSSLWLQKPTFPDAKESKGEGESDIVIPTSLHLGKVPPDHFLTFNAYPVLRPSYLLLTSSATHRQTSPLNVSDFSAARLVIERLEHRSRGKKHFMIYNCGKESGCSRLHKHTQFFEYPEDFVMFPDRSPTDGTNVPYSFRLIRHRSITSTDVAEKLVEAYASYIQHLRSVLGVADGGQVPHNVVMTQDWTLIIGRRKRCAFGVGTNTVGMVGMVWLGSEEEMELWNNAGPFRILGEMGIPTADNPSRESNLDPAP